MIPRSRVLALLVLVLSFAEFAVAQPSAWTVTSIIPGFLPTRRFVSVLNLATGVSTMSLEVPSDVTIGSGTLTPDGQYYLLTTSVGLARFRTSTREFVGLFGPTAAFTQVWVSPTGTIYAGGSNNAVTVLHATTGAVVGQRTASNIVFSPDGEVRYEFLMPVGGGETALSAYAEGAGSLLWTKTVSRITAVAASPTDLVLGVSSGDVGETLFMRRTDGTERGRLAIPSQSLACCSSGAVITSQVIPEPLTTSYALTAIDLGTLETRTITSVSPSVGILSYTGVMLSSDGAVAYWIANRLSGQLASIGYTAVDVETGATVGEGGLAGSRSFLNDLDIEPGAHCVFDLPTSFSIGAAGGIIRVPVTPRAACGPWTTSSVRGPATVANPGPHVGPAIIDVSVAPASDPMSRVTGVTIGGRFVSITQAGGPPAAPDVTFSIVNRRVVLTWTIAGGGTHFTFVVRGGPRGTAAQTLAITGVDVRTWTSDPLPPGSYFMEVVARGTFNGDGPPSNRVEFSLDVAEIPLPPLNLAATSSDSSVSMTWLPAPDGPAPRNYVIEAAAAGSAAFGPVAIADEPRFFATRVPAGDWQVRVRATTAAGFSAPSNTVSVKTGSCTAPPSPPLQLTVTAVSAIPSLRWQQPASGPAEEYILEVGPSSSSSAFGRVVLPGASRAYEVTAPGGVYYVRARARNACGESGPSNEVIAVSYATP